MGSEQFINNIISMSGLSLVICLIICIGLLISKAIRIKIKAKSKKRYRQEIKNSIKKDANADMKAKASFDLMSDNNIVLIKKLNNIEEEPSNKERYSSLYMEFDKQGRKI